MVEHSTLNSKIKGLNPAISSGRGKLAQIDCHRCQIKRPYNDLASSQTFEDMFKHLSVHKRNKAGANLGRVLKSKYGFVRMWLALLPQQQNSQT